MLAAESEVTGRPLDQLYRRTADIAAFLRVAIGIAGALADLHQSGFVHKNIKPHNILVDNDGSSVRLTDLSMASRLPREATVAKNLSTIQGTLAYMSPEQTGRMNRWIDSRTDLYSLGVTFYQMLAGRLPFEASDALEWVHCHVARSPRALTEIDAAIPKPISDIILKLLAKAAEDRYQSARGLKGDLEICLEQSLAHGQIEPFTLGSRDIPERVRIPQRLYGREAEVERLLGVFDRVAETGATEVVLVRGYSGVGKSSLVHELHRPITRERGAFVSGKFDQYKRNIPYSTIDQAFRQMVLEVLTESEEQIGVWRERLRDALGASGQIVIDLVPEVELIIGKQPEVPALPLREAQSRFNKVVQQFLGAFTRPDHPVVLFLDDLQWADAASLDLLKHIISSPDTKHLLFIGAYRDNEVSPSHPLVLTLEDARRSGSTVHDIVLSSLSAKDLDNLIADALHRRPEEVANLGRLVHARTAGNPFFAIQFLLELEDERLVGPDPDVATFRWDIAKIEAKGFTDNVVDLMVGKLLRLPVHTQEALKLLACLGNSAGAGLLTMLHHCSEERLHADLWEAVRAGLVVRIIDGTYRFLHDRIQEAAYSRIPEGERAAVHLRLGSLLLSHTSPEELEARIFEIVNQFDRGAHLIPSPEERVRVAKLNLLAGKRAKGSAAYASALRYLGAGAALLSEDSFVREYELAFALELDRAECEYLTGAYSAAEKRLSMLTIRAKDLVDAAAVTCAEVELFTTQNQPDRSIDAALKYLQRVGIEWPRRPTAEEARREYEEMLQKLGDRPIEPLVDLPLVEDARIRATLDVLTALVAPVAFCDEQLLCLVVCRMVNISLDHGNCDGSALAYTFLGNLLGPFFGDYRAGFRFGKLGLALIDKRRQLRFRARVYASFGMAINAWTQPLREGLEWLRRGSDIAAETGDLLVACACFNARLTLQFAAGEPLADLQRDVERGLAFVRQVGFGLFVDVLTGQERLIRTLRGLLPAFSSFNDAQFDESRFEAHLDSHPALAMAKCYYWIRKLQARYFAGDYVSAAAAGAMAEPIIWLTGFLFERAEYHFYRALSLAAHIDSVSANERSPHIDAVLAHLRQLEAWAENSPENFKNRAALIAAEVARIRGEWGEAAQLYEVAIRSARDNGFIQNEALAYETAARFYRSRGYELFADTYLREARDRYLRWGADGKVWQLERQQPQIATRAPLGSAATLAVRAEHLDLLSVIKASQSISGEILLPRLQQTLIQIVLEAAGAQMGCLLRSRGGELFIEIEAVVEEDGHKIRVLGVDVPLSANPLPASILNYVKRTRERVILDDATKEARFAADPYITSKSPRSVLCLPLMRQAELVGLFYLENNLAAGAFTPDRIEVLALLASQAAISLENATLYSQVSELNAVLEQRVADRTAELVAANKELEAFSYSVSHDLRAPIRTIDTFSKALEEDYGNKLDAEALTHISRVRKATQRTKELIDDLLKLSQVTRGEMTRQEVDLSALSREVLAELEKTDPGREVEIVIAGGLLVDGDERLLRAALENLLGNAWKFTKKRVSARIEVGAMAQEDGRLAYYVRDNGAGFDMKYTERLFHPFHRMHKASDFPGTGVGLATVQRIINRHGGRIWAEAANGQGATFYLTL